MQSNVCGKTVCDKKERKKKKKKTIEDAMPSVHILPTPINPL